MTSSIFYLHLTIAISSEINPQEIPILIAVSFLSPVNIQTLTPAYFNLSIVIFTLSCNRSSIAVAPTNSNYFSIISYNYLVLLVIVVVLDISAKCFSKNFFWDSVRTELSLRSLLMMIVGFYYCVVLFPY
jgi:hypothetical protein